MEIKKNPKFDLGRNSLIFFQVGLIVMLFGTWTALEWKSFDRQDESSRLLQVSDDLEEIIPITETPDIAPPPPPPPQAAPQVIIQVDDDSDVEETIIESTETNQDLEIADVEQIVEVETEEEEVIFVPFAVIENVPIYPGCESLSGNNAKKECMSEKIQAFVQEKFNTDLAGELGLQGRMRISVQFRIDKSGRVVDVKARAPHPQLEKEAVKVVGSLPKMIPGMQRGVPVGVLYALPILFEVRN